MALTRRFTFFVVLLLLFSFCSSCSASGSAEKVHLSLYYESLCPYCSRFIVNHLQDIFTNGLVSVVELELVPYGNARVKCDGNITCQHGPYECLLNTVEACAIEAWPDVAEHFNFIYCVEQLVVEGTYMEWESCFQKFSLKSQFVLNCSAGEYGKKLELQYAAQTNALEPPHQYVPWVVVNGKPLYDDYEAFQTEICKAYKGDLPKACEELLLETPPTTKANVEHVSYRDENAVRSVLQPSRNRKVNERFPFDTVFDNLPSTT